MTTPANTRSQGGAVHIEAVAKVVMRRDGLESELAIEWLSEGGICSLAEGAVLMVADAAITDDEGAGTVYLAAPASAQEAEEDAFVIERLSGLLAGVAIALKGEEAPLHRHSYHDLVELAQTMKLELDLYRAVFPNGVPESALATAPSAAVQQVAALTDEQIVAAWQEMPGGPDGWLKQFGYIQFARAILKRAGMPHHPPRVTVEMLDQIVETYALANRVSTKLHGIRAALASAQPKTGEPLTNALLQSVAERIAASTCPEEESRIEIAYAIARHLKLDGWLAAYQEGAPD